MWKSLLSSVGYGTHNPPYLNLSSSALHCEKEFGIHSLIGKGMIAPFYDLKSNHKQNLSYPSALVCAIAKGNESYRKTNKTRYK